MHAPLADVVADVLADGGGVVADDETWRGGQTAAAEKPRWGARMAFLWARRQRGGRRGKRGVRGVKKRTARGRREGGAYV